MLSDMQVERYARQVVLPEVGGRGQERLLASRIAVRGAGPVSLGAADLLRRAGVQVTGERAGERPAVVVDLELDATAIPAVPGTSFVLARARGTRATLTVLPGAPCPACSALEPAPVAAADPLTNCGLHALAALAATEALLVLLAPAHAPRRFTIDLSTGTLAAIAIAPCPHGAYGA